MIIYVARKRTSMNWKPLEITWDQFRGRVKQHYRTTETMREYKAMEKADKDAAKEAAGGFVAGELSCGRRKTEYVVNRCMITLDADQAKPDAWRRATMLADYRMCCYSTHSHTPDQPRLRWIIPTDRVMLPDEYPAVARYVASLIDIDSMDSTTYEVARLMYWPTCSQDGIPEYHEQEGPLLCVDEVLRTYGPNDAWKDSTLWPIGKDESEPKVSDRLKKLGAPCEKPGIIGLFCRTFDVEDAINAFLGDKYEEACPGRYTYLGGSTAGGARVYNNGAYLYSSHATDPAGGYSCNAFDLVRIHKFGHLDSETGEDTDVTKLPSYKAMTKWALDLPEVKLQMSAESRAEMYETFGDIIHAKTAVDSQNHDTADDEHDDEDNAWETKLKRKKTGECEPNISNALLILLHDPALKGALAYDKFSERPTLRRDVPWRPKGSVKTEERGTGWEDLDEAGIRWYLQVRWKYKSENDLRNAIEMAFHANEYHPIREYLNSLVWDGVERLDTMFIDRMGAEDNAYVRSATRKWMCGAVARVMTPGCKFDQMIVLGGKQSLGKSTFADVLSKGWFNDSNINMNDKDGYASLHGNWIIELAELASTRRSDVETVKTFLSKREDTYRPAYARRVATFKRQCVFYGTTNETEFLKDRTGNRRFWVINVERQMDQDALRRDVDQLWAEAVVRWKAGEKLWITDEEEQRLWQEAVDQHTVQDDLEGLVLDFLDKPLPDNWSDLSPESRRDWINGDLPGVSLGTVPRMQVSLTEIKMEMLGEDRRKSGGNDLITRRLANILNNTRGWKKQPKKSFLPGYGAQWVYARTATDLSRWQEARLNHLLS